MRHRAIAAGILIAGFLLCVAQEARAAQKNEDPAFAEISLCADDRILVLAPHPDDEVLGCAGIIQKAKVRGIPVHIVFFTYGDFNEWSFIVYHKRRVFMPKAVQGMGMVRHDEAIGAAASLGLGPRQLTFLGYPDFGTLTIWDFHWGDTAPFRSALTRANKVPYRDALRPGAPYKGQEVLQDLETVIRDFKPTKIFVSHPADHNQDHRALYLFTRVALWDLRKELTPQVYPYLIHFARWPLPRGYHPDDFLVPPRLFTKQIAWQQDRLDSKELDRKAAALHKHRSQYMSSGRYLLSFVRANEIFGDFSPVRLSADANPFVVSGQFLNDDYAGESERPLTAEERASFVGIEKHFISLEDDDFVLSINLSRPLGKGMGVVVYLFGYRGDVAFVDMPKINLRVGALRMVVHDAKKRVSRSGIRVTRRAKQITIRIPLATLKDPERLLVSTHTYLGGISLDTISWREVEIVS